MLDRLERKHGGTIAAVLAHAEPAASAATSSPAPRSRSRPAAARLAEARAQLAGGQRRAAQGARRGRAEARRGRARAPGRAGDEGRGVRDRARRAARARPDGRRRRRVPHRAEPRRAGRPAARDRLGRRAVARHARADGRRGATASAATLVFDEVDAGIGGQTARAVGDQLRELAAGRQVLCITHLPQIASLAARHFSIAKDTATTPAQTTVSELREGEVVCELVRMLGADDDADEAADATPRSCCGWPSGARSSYEPARSAAGDCASSSACGRYETTAAERESRSPRRRRPPSGAGAARG